VREVRWLIQHSRKGSDYWVTDHEATYTGWFYATGNDQPSERLLEHFEEAKKMDWMDWRLVQEERTFISRVLQTTKESNAHQ